MKNNYISAYHDRYRDKIQVWERNENGQRIYKEYNPLYYFYVQDKFGEYKSLNDEPLKKIICSDKEDFEYECRNYKQKYESDVGPLDKVLMDNYYGIQAPKIVYGLLDIETDYDPNVGFSGPKNPYAVINALTLYRSDLNEFLTLAIPSKKFKNYSLPADLQNVILLNSEKELLETFLELFQEVDVFGGWNSEFFDVPYIAKRIELVLGKSRIKQLGFDGGPDPKWGELQKFKNSKTTELVLDIKSRIHLDYMRLFKKFNLEGRDSYSLAAIAEAELDIPKLSYDGSLADLYNNDFETFLRYNIRDTEILKKLEEKFKYIELANQMVHEATVNFDSIFGSVRLIDTAIMNYSHSILKKILPDSVRKEGKQVEGALVMTPKPGLYHWVGSVDINSLYPSVYRSLNLSPEMILGQFENFEEDWKILYEANNGNKTAEDTILSLKLENTNQILEQSAIDFLNYFKDKKIAVSAYGTILDQSRGQGLLPSVLTYWFKGRKELQAKKKEFAKKAKEILEQTADKTNKEYLEFKKQEEYFDMAQGIRKVLLNSTYGATLSQYDRFFDSRLGASTTGTGRQITSEMVNFINEAITQTNIKLKKTVSYDKDGIVQNDYTLENISKSGAIYGDTDSCYFSLEDLCNKLTQHEKEQFAINFSDELANACNENFKSFMQQAFLCNESFNDLIKANREIVASSAILQAKKKYIMKVIDIEGTSISDDNPKCIKTMGSDIKLTSTPKIIRSFIKDVTLMILNGEKKEKVNKFIVDYRKTITNNKNLNILDFASISSVNEYDEYYQKFLLLEKNGGGKANLPGNARASINYNEMLKYFNDKESLEIKGGNKIKIIWLKPNQFKLVSMAFPSDTDTLPKWFLENFEIDLKATEQKMIDQKMENVLGAIGWEVPTEQTLLRNSLLSF